MDGWPLHVAALASVWWISKLSGTAHGSDFKLSSLRTSFYASPLKKGAYCFALVCPFVCRPSDVRSTSLDPFAWKLPNLVQWKPLGSRRLLLILRSHGQRYRSSCWSWKNVCSISVDPFTGKFPNLVQWIHLTNRWPLLMFRSHGQMSRSNCWS